MSKLFTRRMLRWTPAILALVATVMLAACGAVDDSATDPAADESSGATSNDDATSEAFPVTVDGVEIARRPERIVSLSASTTELLFAVGAGDAVVAADEYSNYPPDAPTTDLSGFQPNIEAISAYEPDLVVASDNPGDMRESLAALDIPTLLLPSARSIDEVYEQLAWLGDATGNADTAQSVVDRMRADIAQIVADVDTLDTTFTYYHELTPDYYSVRSDTFIGDAYRLLGLESIADAVGDAAGQYPQLTPEFIIDADPDLILLADADCCGVTPEEVAARPGWSSITAVRTGAIVELDEDIASRWGPRIVDLMRDVAGHIAALD